MSAEEPFLSRWSRRKQEVRKSGQPSEDAGAQPEPVAAEAVPATVAPPMLDQDATDSAAEISAQEIAALPSVEDMTAETDVSVFLRNGVPESLRNAALRRMWSLDPKIRDFVGDGREYAYDWNAPGGVPGFGGPLPPPEEIEKIAAKIVGAMKPEAQSLPESQEQSEPLDEASQNCESTSLERELTSDANLEQATSEPTRIHRADVSLPIENETAEQFTTVTRSSDESVGAAVAQASTVASERPGVRRHGGAKPL